MTIRSARWFTIIFSCVFLPFFCWFVWFIVPEEQTRWLLSIGGTVCGTILFGLFYGLRSYHESLGDYLVLDRADRVFKLPRLKREFPFDQVLALQWITGRSENYSDVETDLNLLVKEPRGVVRYFIMGSPDWAIVQQVIDFANIPFLEIKLDRSGNRDADCSPGMMADRPASKEHQP